MRKFYLLSLWFLGYSVGFSQNQDVDTSELISMPVNISQNDILPSKNHSFPNYQTTGGEDLLFESGPFITHPGTPNHSRVQSGLGMITYGNNINLDLGYSIADDMILTEDVVIESIDFFGYQTGSTTTSTFSAVYVRIWDGAPNAGGTVIWGDLTTNRLMSTAWYDTYRNTETDPTNTQRPIMVVTADLGNLALSAGTYWVEWAALGTLSSGPWANPITILGETTTGNALQNTPTGWQEFIDTGSLTPQGIPFMVNGSFSGGGSFCQGILPNYTNSSSSGVGGASQDFEAGLEAFDCMLADDFIVPGTGLAEICEISVYGTTSGTGFNGDPSNNVILRIFEDNAGAPGTEIYSETFAAADVAITSANATMNPSNPPVLTSGEKYWLSVQAQMAFAVSGQWYWTSATDNNDSEMHFINPEDGFGTGCTIWSPGITSCGIVDVGQDLLMDISFNEVEGAEECDIVHLGSAEDGLGILNGGLILANDFRIIPEQTMTVETITMKILSNVSSVNVGFLENNTNTPGATIMAPVNIVPTSQTLVGVTPFGSNIYEVVLELPTPQVFEGGALGTNYWMTISTVIGTEGDNYWEFGSSVHHGTYFYYSADGGVTWIDAGSVGFFVDGAFTLSGECEGGIEPTGCEWVVNVFDTGIGDEVTWQLRDSNDIVLLSGGPYGFDYSDSQTVIAEGPVEFYIEAIGSWNDNTPSYTVSNGTEVLVSGQLMGGDEATYSDLECEGASDPCTIAAFPFTETFEDDSVSRDCWTQIQEQNTANWTYATGSSGGNITTANTGDLNARFVSMNPGGNPHITKLVSPVLDITSLSTPQVTFYYGQEDWLGDQNELKVYYRVSESDPWVEIAHYTANVSSWTEEVLDLPSPSATYQIAFEGINGWGRANVIDDVTIHEGSTSGDVCEQTNPSNPVAADNGYNISPGSGFGVAADVIVAADEDFTLDQVVINVLNTEPVTSVNLNYYSDTAGLPGTVIGSETNIAPTSSTLVGTAFGWNIYEVVLDITPFTFEGQSGVPTTYWIQPETPTFWEVSYVSVVGSVVARLNGGVWALDTVNNAEAVYTFSGVCEPIEGPINNDDCENAIALSCGDIVTGTTIGMNNSGGNSAPDVFYSYTGSGVTELVTISLCGSSFDTYLRVYSDCTLSNQIAFNDDFCGTQSELSFVSDGTSTYIIMVEGWGSNAGEYILEITCTPDDPVLNDECDDAIALECGDTHSGNTVFASDSGGNAAPDVFYSYTGNGEVEFVTVSLCGSNYDTYLRVYSDCTLSNQIAFNDDSCGVQSQLTFESDGFSTYYIMVEGWGSNAGEYTIELTCAGLPGCGDLFTDSGGETGNYNNNEDTWWTFTPDVAGDIVTVTFSEFDIEENWDYLFVYDGLDGSAPLIATLTGNTLPGPFSATNIDGALTFNFVSDGSVNYPGWVALIECGPYTEPNDDCEDAIALSCGDIVSGDTSFATDSGMNPSADVFYTYTGSGSPEIVTLSLCDSNFDTYIRVFTDCDLNNEIAYNDDFCGIQSQVAFMSDGTSTYVIMVEGFGSQFGEYTLEISCVDSPDCGDEFTDTGGNAGNYGANEDIVWTFTPNAGEVATLTFTSFDVEANWDALYVYDGPDTSAPLLDSGNPATNGGFPAGGYWGNTIPGPFTSTHASGALTVRFLSDGSVQNAGWTADVACGIVGMESHTISGLVFYPNPMNNVLNIQADTTIDQVIIYNVLGQAVLVQNVNSTSVQLNVSELASGSYMMKVTSEGTTVTHQVVRK